MVETSKAETTGLTARSTDDDAHDVDGRTLLVGRSLFCVGALGRSESTKVSACTTNIGGAGG